MIADKHQEMIMKKYIFKIFTALAVITWTACDQERLEPVTSVADGGGTLTSYMAYTVDSIQGQRSNVYGRIVFWEDNPGKTLIQVSLFNTIENVVHPAMIVEGTTGQGGAVLTELAHISGSTGELSEHKFYVINDLDYYDLLPDLNAHINIYMSQTDNTIIATGNLGLNAEPIEQN